MLRKLFFSSSRRARAAASRVALLGAAALLAATAACDDPFRPVATSSIRTDTFVVYAVSGTPVSVPTAFNLILFQVMRVDPTYDFDIAFDIDETGRPKVLPVRIVGGAATATKQVGLVRSALTYEALTRAPASGYVFDQPFSLNLGEPLVVQVLATLCSINVSPLVFAKLSILAVNVSGRTLQVQITYNPNCGFRSFLPGVPKD